MWHVAELFFGVQAWHASVAQMNVEESQAVKRQAVEGRQ